MSIVNPFVDTAFCGPDAELTLSDQETGEVIISFSLPEGKTDLKEYALLANLFDLEISGPNIVISPSGNRVSARKRLGFESAANPNFKPDTTQTQNDLRLRKMMSSMDKKQRKLENLLNATNKALTTPDLPVEVIEPVAPRPPVAPDSLADKAAVTTPPKVEAPASA